MSVLSREKWAKQPPATGDHWIVLCMSKDREEPMHRPWKPYFRHATVAEAVFEAQRLSHQHPGRRYAIYRAGPSFKQPKPETPDKTENPPLNSEAAA